MFSSRNITFILALVLSTISTTSIANQSFKTPPTSSTRSHVPVISDEKMEACVKLYNEANWLLKELNAASVDRYSQESVDSYNKQVNKHTSMTGKFNSQCAGKQSRSACKAAQKLNAENGQPVDPC